jgi:thymidylate kinase
VKTHRELLAREDGIRLNIVKRMVEALDTEGIAYCHWKSNEHLDAAVSGKTDLDILFDPQRRESAETVLRDVGFIRFITVWYRRYPDIEDYIGIDESGRVVHVHAHFQLVLGETKLKSYCLDWADEVISSRCWDDTFGIYRSDPTIEMLLLLVREAIKFNSNWRFPFRKGRRHQSGAAREFSWLKQRVLEKNLYKKANVLLGAEAAGEIQSLYVSGLKPAGLARLRRNVMRALSGKRRYSGVNAFRAKLARSLGLILDRFLRKLGFRGIRFRRTTVGRGLIVAFVGADGAGKSTVSTAIAGRFGKKVDVEWVYFGSGTNSPASFLRRLIEMLGFKTKLGQFFRAIWALSLARERFVKLNNNAISRDRGIIVVCDRYPQSDVERYNDGPQISYLRPRERGPWRWLAEWERGCYRQALVHSPDIVFRMNMDLEGLRQRRPRANTERLQMKLEGFRRIHYPESTRIVNLDASQPLEVVIGKAMVEIRRILVSRDEIAN